MWTQFAYTHHQWAVLLKVLIGFASQETTGLKSKENCRDLIRHIKNSIDASTGAIVVLQLEAAYVYTLASMYDWTKRSSAKTWKAKLDEAGLTP